MSLFYLHFWKIFIDGNRILCCQLFSFNILKMSFHCLLAYIFLYKSQCVAVNAFFRGNLSYFLLLYLDIFFFFCLWFSVVLLIDMPWGVFFKILILHKFFVFLEAMVWWHSSDLKSYQLLSFKVFVFWELQLYT